MNTTQQEKQQNSPGSFGPDMGPLHLQSLEQPDWLNNIKERYERTPVEFAYRWEEEFARKLDEHQISWQYKHRTFAVEWDEEGNFIDSFTPDFYLPALDLYVEVVAPDYRLSAAKGRKVRLLR